MKVSTKETRRKYKETSENTCSPLAPTSRDGTNNKPEVPDNRLDGGNQSLDVEDSRTIRNDMVDVRHNDSDSSGGAEL
jgi:hypothetical protein